MTLYFATHNRNKLEEIRHALPDNIQLLGLDDLEIKEEIPETADSIEGNSQMKAKYLHKHFGIACFADDTGLEVDALNGEPGVYSARYAGEEKDPAANINLLLHKLNGQTNRAARFKTVITFINQEGEEKQFTGIVNGEITEKLHGNGGFGYDPVFRPEGLSLTFAEISMEAKNEISHRGRAFAQLINYLKSNPGK